MTIVSNMVHEACKVRSFLEKLSACRHIFGECAQKGMGVEQAEMYASECFHERLVSARTDGVGDRLFARITALLERTPRETLDELDRTAAVPCGRKFTRTLCESICVDIREECQVACIRDGRTRIEKGERFGPKEMLEMAAKNKWR